MEMQVPDHIFVDGRRQSLSSSYPRPARTQRLSFTEMEVPDKITVDEKGQLVAHPSQPNDVLRDKQAPPITDPVSLVPHKLTANQFPSEKLPANAQNSEQTRSNSQLQNGDPSNNMNSSLAVEANPIAELKNVRRQLGRLATRVLELEDESQRRTIREYGLWTFLASGTIILTFLLGRRR